MEEKNIEFHRDRVYDTLKNIFMQRFSIDIVQQEGKFLDKHLLGWDIGLSARDLLYLYFDIEKEFGVTIPEDDIAEGKFTTFNNIVEMLCNIFEKSSKEAV
ncbi:acyl carrier protein [Clostridium cavendishii DSM 21758]|uniref:Acyl carrier protein n=1 Tax=Clostridium cavendishii DSM 21758 TaxID=1121302 RepID=A0A1M6R420_9CLOT|nr:peptide maturation system acyl carrier-related protein [Clostridium cavendishii]SHK27219.1 acyl carrier protein [Clostridium cavendishii DSM 21758]